LGITSSPATRAHPAAPKIPKVWNSAAVLASGAVSRSCNPLAAQGLFWAKVAAGSSLLGALGAAAGAIWGIVEYAEANQ
jgi:hypothetical protein